MNIENLEVGATYKSYREMCKVLDMTIEAGNSKKAQIKEWERYFEYSKQGNKFIITEIYDTPKEKIDFRNGGNNRVKYIDKIEKLILDLLVQEENKGKVFLSKNKLLQTLKMVNENYSYGKYKPLKLSKYTKINRAEISDFYEASDSMLQRNLESALNGLRSKALIIWNTSLTVGHVDTHISMNEDFEVKASKYETTDEDGDVETSFDLPVAKRKIVHRKATDFEKQAIIRTEHEVLEEFGFKVIKDVFVNCRNEEFYKKVTDILFDKYNIYLYYNSYEITYNNDHVFEEWTELEDLKLVQDGKVVTQFELNEDIVSKLSDNADNRHQKAGERFYKTEKMKYKTRMSDTYLSNNKTLIDTLIVLGTPKIDS